VNAAPDMIRVAVVDHRVLPVARALHAIQMAAYAQEAALLGAVRFPPLERTVADVAEAEETYLGAFIAGGLVGALGAAPEPAGRCVGIASLVVDPAHQRKGIARELLRRAIAQHPACDFTVQTGARNAPALALYGRFGFEACGRLFVGTERLALVQLRRPASAPRDVAD
jgi:GNAT superfamily N-acetyltransferase